MTGTLHTAVGAITDVVPLEATIAKRGVADETPGAWPAQGQILNRQADAGAAVHDVATGVDTAGTALVADLTDQTTFTMSPDGSCAGATCLATTPGPHTVTGTFTGVASAAPAVAGAHPRQVRDRPRCMSVPPASPCRAR